MMGLELLTNPIRLFYLSNIMVLSWKKMSPRTMKSKLLVGVPSMPKIQVFLL
jgi:hypothetical protein